jgi:hypothetical protein
MTGRGYAPWIAMAALAASLVIGGCGSSDAPRNARSVPAAQDPATAQRPPGDGDGRTRGRHPAEPGRTGTVRVDRRPGGSRRKAAAARRPRRPSVTRIRGRSGPGGRYGPGVRGTSERQVADVVIRFTRLTNPAGCHDVGTAGFAPFCTAFVRWRYRPHDFAWVRVTPCGGGRADALAMYRSGRWIGFHLIRVGGQWKIDAEQTGAAAGGLGTVTRNKHPRARAPTQAGACGSQ